MTSISPAFCRKILPALICTLLPAGLITALITRYGVNVPYWDEWSLIDLFEKAKTGRLSFTDLFTQHNEHRRVFPKLLFLAFARFTHWNLLGEMYFSVLLCFLSAICLQCIFWKTFQFTWRTLLVALLLNFLLFSPCQHENWLWGFQLSCFLLNFCFLGGLAALGSTLSPVVRFILTAACAIIATFSGGNGILLWPTFLLAFLLRKETVHRLVALRKSVASWIALSLASVAFYIAHYHKAPGHPPLAASGKLRDYYSYISAFIGSALSAGGFAASIFIGTTEILLFFILLGVLGRRRHQAGVIHKAAPWLSMAIFALLSSIMACVARIGFGAEQALASRYTTFSLLFLISLIGMALVVSPTNSRYTVRLVSTLKYLLVVVSAILFLRTWPASLESMRQTYERRSLAYILVTFLKSFPQKDLLETFVFPNVTELTKLAQKAERLHLLQFPLLRRAELERLIQSRNRSTSCGTFDSLRKTGPDLYLANGRLPLIQAHPPAHPVILAYRRGDEQVVPFDFVIARPETRDRIQAVTWTAGFARNAIEELHPTTVEAWTIDLDPVAACRLAGAYLLE